MDDKLIYLKVNRPLQVSSRNMSSHGAYTVLLGAVQWSPRNGHNGSLSLETSQRTLTPQTVLLYKQK